MLDKVQSTIEQHQLFDKTHKILVALSGGPDSTALLFSLKNLGYNVVAGHFDHAWRATSADEALFVQTTCHRLFDMHCEIARAAAPCETEQSARDARQHFLRQLAEAEGCDVIAMGHNANDRVETVIMNLLRGSGLTGLTAMPYKNGIIVRPMLDCSSEEIRQFCDDHNLPVVMDPSNNDMKFKRNLVRAQLTPLLTDIGPAIQSLNILQSEKNQLDDMISGLMQEALMLNVGSDFLGGCQYVKLDMTVLDPLSDDIKRSIVRMALTNLRGSCHNISYSFVDRIISLKNSKRVEEQDVSCFRWKNILFIIINFHEVGYWGPVTLPAHEMKTFIYEIQKEITHTSYNHKDGKDIVVRGFRPGDKFRKGATWGKNTSLAVHLAANHIPSFVHERVPVQENADGTIESAFLY